MTTKLPVMCDGKGRPLMHLAEGQANDHKTAYAVIQDLPRANAPLADRAYGSAAFRQTLVERGITPCIPSQASHRVQHSYDPTLYRPKIESLFAHLPVSNRLRCCLHLLDQRDGVIAASQAVSQCAKKIVFEATYRKGR